MEVGSDPFCVGQKKNTTPSSPPMQNIRFTFTRDGNSMYKRVPSASPPYSGSCTAPPFFPDGAAQLPTGEPPKRKRGRPRKYGPDGNLNISLSSSSSQPQVAGVQSAGSIGFASPVAALMQSELINSGMGAVVGVAKRPRGRPPGSGKKRPMNCIGSTGSGFVSHVLTVKAGEDVSSAIISFFEHGNRALCIVSANGVISNVTIHQAAIPGGTVTYEGLFEILSLSGCFLFTESGGQNIRTCGLSISMADPDGRVFGGGVAGLLIAASPVQVVLGSFIPEKKKRTRDIYAPYPGFSSPTSNAGGSNPTSRDTLSESSGGSM